MQTEADRSAASNNVDKIELNADKHKLMQVFLNLIDNSIEAVNNNGRIELTSVMDEEQNNIKILVIDNGNGISADTKIFEPFFTTKGQRGTGLGLSVIWGILDNHNGSITVESKVDLGTTFSVRLPQNDLLRSI